MLLIGQPKASSTSVMMQLAYMANLTGYQASQGFSCDKQARPDDQALRLPQARHSDYCNVAAVTVAYVWMLRQDMLFKQHLPPTAYNIATIVDPHRAAAPTLRDMNSPATIEGIQRALEVLERRTANRQPQRPTASEWLARFQAVRRQARPVAVLPSNSRKVLLLVRNGWSSAESECAGATVPG